MVNRFRGALMDSLLQFRNLSLGYPDLTLFRQLSFDIDSGTALAVVGANGSGKSTFIKMMLGLVQPLSGQMTLVQRTPAESRVPGADDRI